MEIILIAKINNINQINNYHNIYFDMEQNYFFNKFSELSPKVIMKLVTEYRTQSYEVILHYKQFTKATNYYYQHKI